MTTGNEELLLYAGPIPYAAVWSMITSFPDGKIIFASMSLSLMAFDVNGNCLW